MKLKIGKGEEIKHRVEIDFNKMTISSAEGTEKEIEEFYAIEAVDTAQLKYFILQPDVALIEHNNVTKVQAKLRSIIEEDINSNGKGVTETSLILYNVSEVKEKKQNQDGAGDANKAKSKKKKKKSSALKIVKEPKDRMIIDFYLNQTFLRTQEKKDAQLWRVNPSHITSDGRYFGSVIYEEYGTDELCLNFVTSSVKEVDSED